MGWRYDANGEGILTHAKAITEHPQFTLVAAVDPSADACREFANLYSQVPSFASISAASAAGPFDWIFLALPTDVHFAAFTQALALKPKVIVCEKPLAPGAQEAFEMVNLAKAQGCLLLVNYIRPHEPACKEMLNFIQQGKWGGIEKIIVRYGKGVANSASHFIHLLVLHFGPPKQLRVLSVNNSQLNDPEPDFLLEFPGFSAWFLRFDYQHYALSEMDFYLQQGAIFYRAMGQQIDYQQALPDKLFPSVKRLTSTKIQATELQFYQRHALAAYQALGQKAQLDSAVTQASLQVMALIEQLHTQIKQQTG
jgi:predicted dehydrogenase